MGLNQITERIIGCAIEVHKRLGSGLLESKAVQKITLWFSVNSR